MTGKRTRTRGPGCRTPIRDNRAGLLVCMPDSSWTQPLQVNAARPEHQGRRAKYGAPVVAAFTLLGRSRAPMPHDADGAFMKQGSDSSPRLRLLSSRGTPSPGQTVSVTEGEPPPPRRPGHSGTYRRVCAGSFRSSAAQRCRPDRPILRARTTTGSWCDLGCGSVAALRSGVERSGGPPGGHHLGPPGRAARGGARRPRPRLGQISGERPARRRAGLLPARVRPGRS
jgi:hypothetical protein